MTLESWMFDLVLAGVAAEFALLAFLLVRSGNRAWAWPLASGFGEKLRIEKAWFAHPGGKGLAGCGDACGCRPFTGLHPGLERLQQGNVLGGRQAAVFSLGREGLDQKV